MIQAAEVVRKTANVSSDRIVICRDWPRGFTNFNEKELGVIHKSVMANQHDTVVVILPKNFAARYALRFMLTEKIGQPFEDVAMILKPGGVCLVNCALGTRDRIW